MLHPGLIFLLIASAAGGATYFGLRMYRSSRRLSDQTESDASCPLILVEADASEEDRKTADPVVGTESQMLESVTSKGSFPSNSLFLMDRIHPNLFQSQASSSGDSSDDSQSSTEGARSLYFDAEEAPNSPTTEKGS